ncbi:OmpA family protein [Aridibaculum aurantiacum]|uniref:OmpA family protein n=1 Tax=Aridibaculum aurantiacum TaxID=2810307 RepID=UPI001A9610EC|nr:OmpA family protein [Aridibaculum aurantiacum]
MKKALLFAGCFMLVQALDAQFAYNYLKAADDYYKKGDYFSAAQYYERALGQKPSKLDKVDPYKIESLKKEAQTNTASNREQVLYKTAESYRMVNNYLKAEPYYKEAADLAPAAFPLARYWYGKSLRYNSRFAEAEAALTQFLQEFTSTDEQAADARKEIANLQFIQKELRKDTSVYTVQKISADAYTNGADYAPSLMNNSTLVFTSTRADEKATKNTPHLNRLYKGTAGTGVTFAATKVEVPQALDVHQGVATFTPDGNTMYLTRWTGLNGRNTASIFTSTKTGDTWSEPTPLKGDVNVEGYSSQQPFVSADGKYLFYASNKPGGKGKFDLYVTPVEGSGVSTNLGDAINTEDDEQAPYYHPGSGSLIFSSKGRVGMGGFDFYQAKGTVGSFATPVNLGYPVNSVKDDIYVVSTGDKYVLDNIYFSSDRSSVCCLEMFTLNKKRFKKTIFGLVVDCKTGEPVAGASVRILDSINNQQVVTLTTGTTGKYELTLDEYQPLQLTASAEGFTAPKSIHFNAPANDEVNTLVNPTVCLVKPEPVVPYEVEKPVLMNNIFFEFDRYKLLPTSYPKLNELVALLKEYPKAEVEIGAHTDGLGDDSYNMQLSELRAKSVVEYLVTQGIEEGRLRAKGYGETMPVAPNKTASGKDNPEGRAKNRRVEFKVLHY